MKILVFAGSARNGSFNKMLAEEAAEILDRAGAEARFIDLADFPAPLYDADLEAENGIPASMVALGQLIKNHDALVISTPVYNGHITPLLMNIMSWVSRPSDGEPSCAAFSGKRAVVLSTAAGGERGEKVIGRLKEYLECLGVEPLPHGFMVPKANDAFKNGRLVDQSYRDELEKVVGELL